MDNPSWTIRPARADEADRLRAVDDEAGTLFDGLGLIDEALDGPFPPDKLTRLLGLSQVWVGCPGDDGVPVGMVIASVRDGLAYVEELAVLPAYGRRGLGGRLLATVGDWARSRGLPAVTLSTFRDVPWNGPFYRRHGFRDLSPTEWTPSMPAIRAGEGEHGLRIDARVFMRRDLAVPAKGDRSPLGAEPNRPIRPKDTCRPGRQNQHRHSTGPVC
ncbi:GNAT family N-acetyltransferase [Frankia gtarii]|uniref:GNAT family N-acetyltransferase n=1 Tax=Frankia gtarii TaxID=2950102 RepID=UPI0021C09D03|nr:GNAT family N-acetyltransferase [Frankia gtarii]